MSISSSRESQILQARENLARSSERLQKLIARLPERLKQADAAAKDAEARVEELQELLDRERVITAQRNSLEENSREEAKLLESRVAVLESDLEAASIRIMQKEETISELEAILAGLRADLMQKETESGKHVAELTSSQSVADEVLAKLDAMQDAYRILQQQCLRYESEIEEMNRKDASLVVKMSDDERKNLIAEIDTIIASLDSITSSNGQEK